MELLKRTVSEVANLVGPIEMALRETLFPGLFWREGINTDL